MHASGCAGARRSARGWERNGRATVRQEPTFVGNPEIVLPRGRAGVHAGGFYLQILLEVVNVIAGEHHVAQ